MTEAKESEQSSDEGSASSHCSTALERWDVRTDDGPHTIQADNWRCSGNGLQFYRGEECVAWFTAWLWFKKFDLMSDPNGFVRLGFSVRTRNILDRLECKTIGELMALSDDEIMEARNSGKTVVAEIREKLDAAGFKGDSPSQ